MRPEGAKNLKVLLVYRSRLFISATKGPVSTRTLGPGTQLGFQVTAVILRKIGGTGEATDELARGRGLEKGADGPRFAIGALVAGRGWRRSRIASHHKIPVFTATRL